MNKKESESFMKKTFICIFVSMLALATGACGAGPYGFSKYYKPIGEEESFYETARELTFGAVAARPKDYQDILIGWFGIVESLRPTDSGQYVVRMRYHKHKERHLCEGETDSTCRVTVNHRSTGGFSAILTLRPEDLRPTINKIQPGTLMHVYAKVRCTKPSAPGEDPKCEYDKEGGPMLGGVYYRQWPARYYRTTRSAGKMVR
jgi:hypothetical protein